MEPNAAQTTLSGALGATGPQLIALAGAGGKSAALQRLAEESAATRVGVLATTTTMMFSHQLEELGPLLLEDAGGASLEVRAGEALRHASVVALARSLAPRDKVKGLEPATVDSLWESRVAGVVLVEADGSRGLPLKAFGDAEPQLPSLTTTVVVLAGLDAVGVPLDEDHVHRAGLLARKLGAAPGDRVTPELLGRAVALQVARVRALTPDARVAVLLNKADDDATIAQAHKAADALLRSLGETVRARPDRVVAGSVAQQTYRVVRG